MIALKKNCNIGIDGMEFELGLDIHNLPPSLFEETLKNESGNTYSSIFSCRNKSMLYLNLAKYIRPDNVLPFSNVDIGKNKIIKREVIPKLQSIIDKYRLGFDVKKGTVRNMEFNVTLKMAKGATVNGVLDMLNSFYYFGTNHVYQVPATECKYKKKTITVLPMVKKRNDYSIKVYDKTYEQKANGNAEVENGLLRFEIIAHWRLLGKICNGDLSLENVLNPETLNTGIEIFKEIIVNEIIKHIQRCLKEVTEHLFQDLIETDSPIKTIANYRYIIVDKEVFVRAMEK